jgi:hypothetical protein
MQRRKLPLVETVGTPKRTVLYPGIEALLCFDTQWSLPNRAPSRTILMHSGMVLCERLFAPNRIQLSMRATAGAADAGHRAWRDRTAIETLKELEAASRVEIWTEPVASEVLSLIECDDYELVSGPAALSGHIKGALRISGGHFFHVSLESP